VRDPADPPNLVERAENPLGPWQVAADDVKEDRAFFYYDLFSDETAVPGKTYHYRLKARNAGGVSPASNVE
jgi:hypothetical protein